MSKADLRGKTYKKKKSWSRDKATYDRLQMYKTAPVRNKKGEILYEKYQSKDTSHDTRIQPDRRWFGPTRVITQNDLQNLTEELRKQKEDPYKVLLRQGKIPYSLLRENNAKEAKMNLLSIETYDDTFGPNSKRKKPKLAAYDFEGLQRIAEGSESKYTETSDSNVKIEKDFRVEVSAPIFSKGQSHRIWRELWKVVDSSDVIVQVIDARDPMGTRAIGLEKQIKKDRPHKHMMLLLNKCDLAPTWSTRIWLKVLRQEYPTLAFHASITKPFGKGALIQVLRQYQRLHNEKQQISVGFIGYPNVGKSSVINTLRSKVVCPAAPVPGYTKVWQYITLFRKIFLIDCPGVVYPGADNTDEDCVIKGVVRIQKIEDPEQYVPTVLQRIKREYLVKQYGVQEWSDPTDFLEKLGKRMGRLKKGGEVEMNAVARTVLYDWQKGKLPFFVPPPNLGEIQPDPAFSKIAKKLPISAPTQIFSKLAVREEYRELESQEAEVIRDEEKDEPAEKEVIDWDEVYKGVDPDENEELENPDNIEGQGLPYIEKPVRKARNEKPKVKKDRKERRDRKGSKRKASLAFDEFEVVPVGFKASKNSKKARK
eukprot:TRINITY_DN5828_c0_g1_i1.p1 TRINITY_DN5828_c0_g1~~TRINITY_DN5828_c0_g1_i1.p1  ORF type:complete len:595 (-),score=130.56 TRINITY_DN5828_c0_g1_i1:26-1810(-)